MSKPTQNDRLLAALRHAGPSGLTRIDFMPPHVCDHGEPIINIPGRINNLRNKGYEIDSSGTRHGCAVYVLREREAPVAVAPAPDETSTLFDPAVTHRPLSPYDSEAA